MDSEAADLVILDGPQLLKSIKEESRRLKMRVRSVRSFNLSAVSVRRWKDQNWSEYLIAAQAAGANTVHVHMIGLVLDAYIDRVVRFYEALHGRNSRAMRQEVRDAFRARAGTWYDLNRKIVACNLICLTADGDAYLCRLGSSEEALARAEQQIESLYKSW